MSFFSKGQPLIIFVFPFPIPTDKRAAERATATKGRCMHAVLAAALKTNRNRAESEFSSLSLFFEFSPYRLIEIIKVRSKAELSN
jgi:hypothetical protein